MTEANDAVEDQDGIAVAAADLMTRSGHHLIARLGKPSDLAALSELFAHISARDLDFRFLDGGRKVEADQLTTLLDPDQGMTTFIAFSEDGVAVACATLLRHDAELTAAVSLSVRSDWKGRGVSWSLLDHVLAYAAGLGLKRVTSLESADDREAVNLQREMGFVARLRSADPMQFAMSKAVDPA